MWESPIVVDAAVADVHEMGPAIAQDHGAEGRGHPGEFRVEAALGMDPAVDGLEHTVGGVLDAGPAGPAQITVDEAAHRALGRLAPAPCPADAVRHHGHDSVVGALFGGP
jgi:hypothetical protein